MDIKTKFNFGDKIFPLRHEIAMDGGYWQIFSCPTVSYISTYNTAERATVEYNNKYDEQDCFATREEAEEEVKRRNGNKN